MRNRLPWLYFNLATAFLAGWVVSLFESTIASYAALAIFLPIIAGQGGNAGTQTLTIIVRSIALGDLPEKHRRFILMKEVIVGLLNGLAIGLVVGGVSWLWRNNLALGVITFAAMVMNMVTAGIAGVVIPLGSGRFASIPLLPRQSCLQQLRTWSDFSCFWVWQPLLSAAFQGRFEPLSDARGSRSICRNIRER